MPPSRIPGPLGRGVSTPELKNARELTERTGGADAGALGRGRTSPDASDPYIEELQELSLDLVQLAFDLAGMVDPTPISDGASGLIALARGHWLDAAISGISMIPYVGDLAKAGKLPKYLKSVERAILLAEQSAKAAAALTPGLVKLKQALDLIPAGANKQLDRISQSIGRFLKSRAAAAAAKQLPDIRHRFSFPNPYSVLRGGKRYSVRKASGSLGVPGKVQTYDIPKGVQKTVSGGSGDDAGHLIGRQFGGPGDARNLSKQNWRQNQGGGTWHQLERDWAEKLESGVGVRVEIKEFTPDGAGRPAWREVSWEEVGLDGRVTRHPTVDYMNTHTADAAHRAGSRTQQAVPPTVKSPQSDNVHYMDDYRK